MFARRPALCAPLSVIALLVVGCSSGGGKHATPTTTTTVPGARVVRIDNFPNPEGPVGHFSASYSPKAFAAAIRELPSRLPPSSGHQSCQLGGTVVLTLADGTSRRYGPCSKPTAIVIAMDALYATFSPSHVVANLDECPTRLPASVTRENAVHGLDQKLVPIRAVVVRVCRYLVEGVAASSPLMLAGQGFVTGASLVAKLEAATNGLGRVPRTPQKETCQRQAPSFLVTFADLSRRNVNVEDTQECGWVTNGAFTAQGTRAWRDALSAYSLTIHY
jgi:hypothetical protein